MKATGFLIQIFLNFEKVVGLEQEEETQENGSQNDGSAVLKIKYQS